MAILERLLESEFIAVQNSENTRLKIQFCERLFEKIGEGLEDSSLKCTNKYLSSFFNGQFNKYYDILLNKYPTKYIRRNFMTECASYTFEAVIGFDIMDGGNWNGIIDGTDKKNIKRLVSHIKKTVGFNIQRKIVNDDKLYTRREVDGKKEQHVTISLNLVSLDNITLGCEGEETTFGKLIATEQNFVYEQDGILWHFYQDWLENNKERLLSKTQLKYLENGIYERKMHNRILEKIQIALELENPFGKKTVLEIQKQEEIELWTGLIDIVYNENYDYARQNEKVSNWIINNFDDERVSNIIYDSINASNIGEVVYAYHNRNCTIPSDILYMINNAIEDRLDKLQTFDTQSVKFYRKESEYGLGNWTKEKHEEYAKTLKQFKKNNKKMELNRLLVTPTGIELPKEIE